MVTRKQEATNRREWNKRYEDDPQESQEAKELYEHFGATETSSGKQELWTHALKHKDSMWKNLNRQAPKKW